MLRFGGGFRRTVLPAARRTFGGLMTGVGNPVQVDQKLLAIFFREIAQHLGLKGDGHVPGGFVLSAAG